ncbi:hypothetical protein [Stygiobacter electus]|uniref:Beta-galactosidase trimerisation domain-containing protein n=1 Tax=Stygiobacter electus TaxID=3032292 RepID=A0AAE3P0R5_9BACT|nr:hypothetical protein [Stygiobacter electus]MDF1610705.1 hypothetical protein [Stygiobacter electus]
MAVREAAKGLRVNYLIIFLSGLVLLIVAFLVFLLIIKNIYGNYDLSQILPSKHNLSILQDGKNKRVAVLYSRYTENMLEPGSTWLRDNIDTWKKFIFNAKFQYELISDQDIELGKHYEYKLIVLPGSKSLSDKEIVNLKRYIENGGSVFVTGSPATFSDEGKWRGWDFFTEVFGMKFNREIKPEETYKIHTLRGNLPLTAQIPTGYALKIATWDRPIYAEVLEPRTTQVSFWYDFRKEAGLVREEIQKSAGISYGTYGKGRFVWFGFEINSVLGVQKDFIYFEKLFNNSLNWLVYNPTAFVKDWPEQYDAALVFIPTVTEQSYNINNLNTNISGIKVNPTIFIDPNNVLNDPQLIRSISKKGDIGVVVDIGFLSSPEDTINKLFSKEVQTSTIKFAVDTLKKLTKQPIKAMMPLNGYYDDNTMQAMSQLGIEFLVTDSLTDRSVPEIRIRNNKQIMIITKTARDDYEIVRNYGLTNTEFQRYTYEEDVDRVLFEGGLYVFKVHTNYQLLPQYASVIKDIFQYAKSKKMWITSLQELKNWWTHRGGVEVRYEARSARRMAVELNNPKDEIAEGIVIQVNLNKKVKNVEVSSDIINTKIPKYTLSPSGDAIYFYIDIMNPHETRSLIIDYENVSS